MALPVGVTGVLCETDIDECLSRPCQHAGLCLQQQPLGFEWVPDFSLTLHLFIIEMTSLAVQNLWFPRRHLD